MTAAAPDKQLAVCDDSVTVDSLAMALVDEVAAADGASPAVAAIARRLGIVADRLDEFLAAARRRLAARAMVDQDLQRADAVTHFRSIIRRARAMGASDLADFEPFLKGKASLEALRSSGLDTTLAREAHENATTKLDDDGNVASVTIKRRIRLYSPLEAITLEMKARGELAKIFSLYRGAYDPPPAGGPDVPGGEVIDAEFIDRPRDAAAEELFDAIDKRLEPLGLVVGSDANYVEVIAAAAAEIKTLRRAAKKAAKKAAKTTKNKIAKKVAKKKRKTVK